MIIDDLNIIGGGTGPCKTNSKLIVYSNTVLALSVRFQSLKPIAGRNTQIFERY
ncbi:MAG: hypothetical protein WKF92_00090 [Pyrinomonadaceae bacterium]